MQLMKSNFAKKKKLNVIIFNLPESKNDTVDKRKNDDNTQIQNLRKAIDVEPTEVAKVFRIGRVESSKNSTRPVIVRFKSLEDKINTLKNCHKLRNVDMDGVSNNKIIVKNDLTKKEQEIEKTLIQELKKKRSIAATGEKFFIRNGKIVSSSDKK
jgi:hypothetical protein